ncbi:MAG: hypothetical protein ACSLFR_02625 [Solirubrobacteraceae bacterium]
MNSLIFFGIVLVTLVLVAMEIAVRRLRGRALMWAFATAAVLIAGAVLQVLDQSALWTVLSLVAGALCLTMADRAADAEDSSPGPST